MTYKTILLHVNDERRVANLVDAASGLAERYQAHLIGLYAMPTVPTFGSSSLGASYIKSSLAAFREEADRVKGAFEAACKGRPFVTEWRRIDPGNRDVADSILDHARSADLVVASQSDSSFDFSAILDVPDRLALQSGRPTMIVPVSGRFGGVGKRITLAWNGTRESARAAFDAIPLMKAADNVRVIWLNPSKDRSGPGDLPTVEIATTLARHGIKCEAASVQSGDLSVGDALLSGLTDDGTDLLVMGAYGHSRMRELVFGGATRHILGHMTIPVLMSH